MVCERGGIYRVRFIRLRNSNALLALKLRHYAEVYDDGAEKEHYARHVEEGRCHGER